MTVKGELVAYLTAKEEYRRILRQLEYIETEINKLTVDYSKVKVQTSSTTDLADYIDRLSFLRKKAINEANDMINAMENCIRLIDLVENPNQRDILQLRFIEGKTLVETAEITDYSWRHVLRLQNDAINYLTHRIMS